MVWSMLVRVIANAGREAGKDRCRPARKPTGECRICETGSCSLLGDDPVGGAGKSLSCLPVVIEISPLNVLVVRSVIIERARDGR